MSKKISVNKAIEYVKSIDYKAELSFFIDIPADKHIILFLVTVRLYQLLSS